MKNLFYFFSYLKRNRVLLLCLVFLFIIIFPGEAVEIHRFTILHTNDSHSALRPHSTILDYHPQEKDPTLGGIARLAGLINREREKRETAGETVFVISAGDFYGGDPYAWLSLTGEAAELKLLKQIGYDLVTIGNHEYDYGPEQLAAYLHEAGYPETAGELPVLAANTVIPEEHPLADCGIKDYIIRETNSGLKIGFFALIGDNAVSVAHETGPLSFTSPLETAGKMVEKLQGEGADVVIAITHSGLKEDKELARKVNGIDVIIGGHSHHALKNTVLVGDTVIVQAGYRLEYLGITFIINLSYLCNCKNYKKEKS